MPQPKFEQEITESTEKRGTTDFADFTDEELEAPPVLRWMLCKNNLLARAALPTRLYRNTPPAFKEFIPALTGYGCAACCGSCMALKGWRHI